MACGKGRGEPAAAPAAAAVDIPAAPAGSGEAAGERVPSRRPAPVRDSAQTGVEVVADDDTVHVSSHPDAGVRVWGTFASADGGFSFKGGFSIGAGTGSSPDGGVTP
jgi:hypothetical protein